ncbi:MAG: phosphodiesterase [Spirochaetes bacterium ADurb.Bin269]|nr:MAG: phosphodiesterase [Spirochaetes bacterium ADurb.Bin269]
MKVLIISDGHGDIAKLDAIAHEFKDADVVLFGGDFARFGAPETGLPYLESLAARHDQIFGVTGNCDEPGFADKLEEYDIGIEKTLSYFNGLMLSGSGGGSKFTGDTPYERDDEELAGDLALAAKSAAADASAEGSFWNNLVIITHNPPKDTVCDRVNAGFHVGSPLIREFIETYKPLLAVSGHIHESAGIEKLGPTTLVNPGSLALGSYAVAEISGGGKTPFQVASIELKKIC